MIGLFSRKNGKPSARARFEVEALEDRALMAFGWHASSAGNLLATLTAKDNINLAAISARAAIQQNQIYNLNQLSQVILDGQNQTAAIAANYQQWVSLEASYRAANNGAAVAFARQQQAHDLFVGSQVRSWIRIAVASSQTTQGQLIRDQGTVNYVVNTSTNYLARHYNPTVVQTQAQYAINYVGGLSQQHYTSGAGSLFALDTLINNAFTPPQQGGNMLD